MTYFGVLARFILPPILILAAVLLVDYQRGRSNMRREHLVILGAHVLMALLYTTPWDNYLVATGVWWYDESLVTGITLGYVPIEEYTFFIVQTVMTGLWTFFLMRFVFPREPQITPKPAQRWAFTGFIVLAWVASTVVLLSGWVPGTYLTLILSWALIPVFVQVVFGGDILLRRAGLVAAAIWVPTLYLWVVDYLAIQSGTWTIDPIQTTGVMLGILPIEEMLFFFMTNMLIGFGITLMLSAEAKARAQTLTARLRRLLKKEDHVPAA